MITHDLGKSHFWGIDKAIGVSLFYETPVHEAEHPFRSAKAKGISIPLSDKGILFGRWGQAADNPVTHLLEALKGRYFDPQVPETVA